jgi:hypothetical protein
MSEVLSVQQELERQPGLLLPQEAEAFLELLEMGRTDGVSAWRAPSIERRDGSAIEGRGLFAAADIPANSLIAIKTGHVLTSEQVKENGDIIQGSQQQIGPNQFLAGLDADEVDKNLVGYNHSCDPNAKVMLFKGASLSFLVTREPVAAGDEITADYSVSQMTNTHLMKTCRCGSPDCRGFVAPLWDWEDEALQQKYAGEFAWFIQDAIDAREQLPEAELQILNRGHATLKQAGILVLADEGVRELENRRDEALSQIGSPWGRALLGRYYDRKPAGLELAEMRDLRLKTAAYFAAICQFANIDDFGIDRERVVTALKTDSGNLRRDLRGSGLATHLDEVVGFARQLDRLFNG